MINNIKVKGGKTIAILGGSGFVGKALLLRLAKDGHNLRVLTRHKIRHREIEVYPNTRVLEVDVKDEASLIDGLAGCDTVINLIGILNETRFYKQNSFQDIHVDLVRKIIKACDMVDISRLLQVSAINADPGITQSDYLRSKGEGENIALVQTTAKTKVTVVKPSIIFGEHDAFINMFAKMLRMPLLFLPLACPDFKFTPIAVEDVANIIARLLDDKSSYGKVYNLCGEEEYSLYELVKMIGKSIDSKVKVIPLSKKLSKIQARILGVLPGRIFTLDNFYSLQRDAICDDKDNVLTGVISLESRMPTIVNPNPREGKFSYYRTYANRQ